MLELLTIGLEAAGSSETLVNASKITSHINRDVQYLNIHCPRNLESQLKIISSDITTLNWAAFCMHYRREEVISQNRCGMWFGRQIWRIFILSLIPQLHVYPERTPWSGFLLEKLTVTQRVKKLLAFYGPCSFITVFTTTLHWSLSSPQLPTIFH
jgi:hypothetical protein